MAIAEKRRRTTTHHVDPDLLDQGIKQLLMEIQILQDWLKDIDDSEELHRRSYEDMLRSRREMLHSLSEQKLKLQSTPPQPDQPTGKA
jgi:hypothetical protein